MGTRPAGKTISRGATNMRITLRGSIVLLSLTFVLLLAAPAVALAQGTGGSGTVKLQGQSKQACDPGKQQCDEGYQTTNLSGWQELDEIPMRLKFTGTGTYTVNVDFDHFKSSDKSPGVQDLYGWAAGPGVELTKAPVLTKSTGDVWTYTLEARVSAADAVVNFKGNLAAGAHYFTGSSLAVSADNGAGTLQIHKPDAAPGTPDLAVNKSGPASAGRDQTVSYTLDYQNKSSATSSATGVQLTDVLPAGVTYAAGSCSGTCTVAGNEVTWNLGTLAPGASGSRTLQVRIPADAAFGAKYVNNARILSAENDANLVDNTSSLETTVSFNRAPSAAADSLTTDEDTAKSIDVLANDTDPDGDALTVTGNTSPQNGSVVRNGGTFTYTPNANFNGADSFTYTVSDGKGGTTTGTVNVTVNPVNDAPKAADDSYGVDEDKTLTIEAPGILSNDSDVENDPLAAAKVAGPTNGTLGLNADGSFAYTPNKDFNGTDSFTYKANDGGLDSNAATVSITVRPVNDAPVAEDDTATTPEDTPIVILAADLLRNDSTGPVNEGGQTLTITRVSGATNGQVALDSEGNVVFTPAANHVGGASFDYTVCDDGGTANGGVACFQGTATIRVTVSPVNDAPVARDDLVSTPEDTAKDIDVLANDSDVENDSLTAAKVSDPAHGMVTAGPDGKLTYTPNKDFSGADSFTYKANDGGLDSNVAEVTVTVTPADDAPKATDDSYEVDENETLTVEAPGVLSNDSDADGDSLTSARVTDAAYGTLALAADGSFTYTPNAGFDGADSFTYKASGGGVDSNAATVSITVNPINDAPVARDDRGSTGEAEAVGNSYISQYASPAAGTPTRLYRLDTAQRPYTLGKIGGDIVSPVNAIGYRSTDNSLYGYRLTGKLGIVKIDPNTGTTRFLGNPRGLPASTSYIAGDVSPNGSTYYLYGNRSGVLRKVDLKTRRASSVKLSKKIDVADLAVSPNDGKLYGVAKDGKLLKVDPRAGRVAARSVAGLSGGTYGATWFTAKGDLIAYENGASREHGMMTWIADPTTNAPSVVSTQAGPSTRGNDGAAYVAPPDPAGLSVVVDVLANDGDPDGALDRDTLRIAQPPANGTASINADKTITYTSGSSYRGADSFRYEVCDGGAPRKCATATVDITSAPVTDQASPAASQRE